MDDVVNVLFEFKGSRKELKKYLSINFLCSNLLCHIETVMNCYVVAKRQQAGIDCGYWQFLVCEQLLDGKFGYLHLMF